MKKLLGCTFFSCHIYSSFYTYLFSRLRFENFDYSERLRKPSGVFGYSLVVFENPCTPGIKSHAFASEKVGRYILHIDLFGLVSLCMSYLVEQLIIIEDLLIRIRISTKYTRRLTLSRAKKIAKLLPWAQLFKARLS